MATDFDVFALSDDDLKKTEIPENTQETTVESSITEEQPTTTEETPAEATETPAQEGTQEAPGTPVEQPREGAPSEGAPPVAQPQEAGQAAAQPKAEQTAAEADKKNNPTKVEQPKPTEDGKYKSFYEALTAPIKGGGTTIQVKSPEEAIALMQKGLDYTRKTQELAKDRKYILMLSQAGLLNEDKLDHLIAISKGDKTALARFLKDSKIDPIEIDTKEGDNYKPGAHVVSDSHANLDSAIRDLESTDGGKETLVEINTWDKESKEILWKQPSLLKQMHDCRQAGVYKIIADEVRRLKALGQLPAETPFLFAFKDIGNQLQAQGKLGGNTNAAPKPPTVVPGKTPVPVARRTASPPVATKGNAQVRAAAATRTTPSKSKPVVPNIMDVSDEDLAKLKF
jgi:cell fate (sporulation/competence/biofilm development) regulator YlbF (YheA/YmcA/DUF963 family)